MEIVGRIIHLGEVIQGTSKAGNEWKKRDVVIETIEQYSNKVCLNVWSDNVEHSLLQIGATLKFSIAIQSREYNGKWYSDVTVIRFESDVNIQNNLHVSDDILFLLKNLHYSIIKYINNNKNKEEAQIK